MYTISDFQVILSVFFCESVRQKDDKTTLQRYTFISYLTSFFSSSYNSKPQSAQIQYITMNYQISSSVPAPWCKAVQRGQEGGRNGGFWHVGNGARYFSCFCSVMHPRELSPHCVDNFVLGKKGCPKYFWDTLFKNCSL